MEGQMEGSDADKNGAANVATRRVPPDHRVVHRNVGVRLLADALKVNAVISRINLQLSTDEYVVEGKKSNYEQL
jgi:hypothetical protein